MDTLTQHERSKLMAKIHSRGNKVTELALAKLFRKHKITGWRRQVQIGKAESGKRKFKVRPDFVFRQVRLAMFVDGCFWHGCPKHGTQPKGNRTFWEKKFARNIARDKLVNRTLRRNGWRVVRVWEHELAKRNETRLLRKIQEILIRGNS